MTYHLIKRAITHGIFYGFASYCLYKSLTVSVIAFLLSCILCFFDKGYARDIRNRDMVEKFEKLLEIMSSTCSVPRNFMHSFEESLRSYVSVYENDVMKKAIASALMKISANSSSEDILNSFAKDIDISEGYMFFENILLCEKKGGNISKTVRETASFIKEKIDIYYEIEVITAEKKTEQLIVSVMPFAVLALFMMSGTGYLDVMYTTDIGRIMMTAAGCLFMLSFYAAKKILEVKI